MAAPEAGPTNKGQHIYLPTRLSNGIRRELKGVRSVTVNTNQQGAPTRSENPDGSIRVTDSPTPQADTLSVLLNWMPGTNFDHAWLAESGKKQLEFVQDEIVFESVDLSAQRKLSIAAATGLVTATGDGLPEAGKVGDALQFGGKDYEIVAVFPQGVAAGDLSPSADKGEISGNLFDNVVYVRPPKANIGDVTSGTLGIVRSGTTTGSMVGSVHVPKMAGFGNDVTQRREVTLIFTPDSGLVIQALPDGKNPYI